MTGAPIVAVVATAGAASAGGWLPAWELVDLPMLLCLPVLLVVSGFFSGSETALFGLTEAERLSLRHGPSLADRAVDALLDDEGMLLITILLANTTINVLYFIISSVLILRSEAGAVAQTMMAIGFLILIVLAGEVAPKVLASAIRSRFAAVCAPLLLTVHRSIAPIRILLRHLVIAPLSRLTAPSRPPPELSDDELKALIRISGHEGIIEPVEQRIISDVLSLRRLKVRDVMTPRVRMVALPVDATRADVARAVRESRRTKVPLYDGDVDHIRGVLHAKRYLLDPDADRVTAPAVMSPPQFVPDVASLDQLLDHFRRSNLQSAIVVDEFGGTQGIVAVEDVVEEVVGDIAAMGEQAVEPPQLVGLGRWLVSGELSVREWAEMFEVDLDPPKITTVGGLITERLGHPPAPGEHVQVQHVRIDVETVDGSRVVSAIVSLRPPGAPEDDA